MSPARVDPVIAVFHHFEAQVKVPHLRFHGQRGSAGAHLSADAPLINATPDIYSVSASSWGKYPTI